MYIFNQKLIKLICMISVIIFSGNCAASHPGGNKITKMEINEKIL